MPDLSTLLLFAAACLALAMTPGPDMLLIATRSAAQGRRAGFATLAGIQLGTYCHALLAALGLSKLFLLVPAAYDAVRIAGAAYLLYLAWGAWRSGAAASSTVGAPRLSTGRIVWQGFITNLTNPKMALFVLALFPQFLQPQAGPVAMQILLLATELNLIGFIVNGAVILLAGRLGARLSGSLWLQRALSGVFAGLAVRLLWSERAG